MAPDIVSFPNQAFYDSRLQTAHTKLLQTSKTQILSRYLKPNRSVTFVHHAHPESTAAKSRLNRGELEMIAAILEDLFKRNATLRDTDIGIITPYTAQTSFLKDLRAFLSQSLQTRVNVSNIQINTVDSFQGQEKKIIILSTVRSNASESIGL